MYRLGWSSRWRVEATKGKKRVEAANSHRNPQGFDTRGGSTTMNQGARKMITTIHSNTITRTINNQTQTVVASKMDFIVGNWGVPPGFWDCYDDVRAFSRYKGCKVVKEPKGGCARSHGSRSETCSSSTGSQQYGGSRTGVPLHVSRS